MAIKVDWSPFIICKISLVILLATCHSSVAIKPSDMLVLESIAAAMPALQQLPSAPWTRNFTAEGCLWEGVGCDSFGQVSTIDLRNRGLQGAIPDAICSFLNLSAIILSNNSLALPASFENCTTLTRLEWNSNEAGRASELFDKMIAERFRNEQIASGIAP
eukprot:TRINITY_DN13735_c0_g1_i1.p1 TRINITY_DN13735_c0_g1~~TRINITY_DN13735_c0_g1_i1.p1  ORF type:complete len:161 (+),score=11.32 TRINITY_DN13735_c0_g1_i1:84-566(+)